MIVIIVILSILLSIAIYFSINTYIKNKKLIEANIEYDDWFGIFNLRIRETIGMINEVDHSGVFEADDDVGHSFQSIKEIINDLNDLVTHDDNEGL